MTIGLVHGGNSTEWEVSTRNAGYIEQALRRRGYDTRMIFYDESLFERLRGIDFVFLCVQGKRHGDGTLQGILDFLGIPYTGSGMTAAALINDKILSKELFVRHGHATPAWTTMTKETFETRAFDADALRYPFVAKAPSQGGSFGIKMIRDKRDLPLMANPFHYDDEILLEDYAPGTFATVGLLADETGVIALPCVEGLDRRKTPRDNLTLFIGDYSARASLLSSETQKRLQDIAIAIFREFRAQDYARVDFIVSEDETRLDVLEINAVPGLKPQSLYPQAASSMGIEYDDLIERILCSAKRRWEKCSGT